MSELEDKINSVLNDPQQMEQITKLAQSLMGEESSSAQNAGFDLSALTQLGNTVNDTPSGDKQALLNAMKPYLSEKRRSKMDRAMKFARLAKLARLALRNMEGGDV